MTPEAESAIPPSDYMPALLRHIAGDWGDLDPTAWFLNDLALTVPGYLGSRYYRSDGLPFWIITVPDRSITTILLRHDC